MNLTSGNTGPNGHERSVDGSRTRNRKPLVALAIALAFVLAACGGGDEQPNALAAADLSEDGLTAVVGSDIDFGDDSSVWANDGECDDPRFQGPGTHSILLEEDRGADATDCRTLYEAGQITLRIT